MSIVQELMNGTVDAQNCAVAPTGTAIRAAKYIQSLEAQHQQHLVMINQLQSHQNDNLQIIENLREEITRLKEKNVVEEITTPANDTSA